MGQHAFYVALCFSIIAHGLLLWQLLNKKTLVSVEVVSNELPLKVNLISAGGNKNGTVKQQTLANTKENKTPLPKVEHLSTEDVKLPISDPQKLPEPIVEPSTNQIASPPIQENIPSFGFGGMPNFMLADRRRGLFEPPSMPQSAQQFYDAQAIEMQRFRFEAFNAAMQELMMELGGLKISVQDVTCTIATDLVCNKEVSELTVIFEKYKPRFNQLDASRKLRFVQTENGWSVEDVRQ